MPIAAVGFLAIQRVRPDERDAQAAIASMRDHKGAPIPISAPMKANVGTSSSCLEGSNGHEGPQEDLENATDLTTPVRR